MKIVLVVGARPNFMKAAAVLRAMRRYNQEHTPFFEPVLVHTGQHYDFNMSQVFFQDLELPEPDIHLAVGSGSHGEQTGRILIELERVLIQERPGLVVVVGDVNSTLAGALAAVKLHIPVAHVEAGLRSYDRNMPEEINRLLTDAISDYLFTPSPDADQNLAKEGIGQERVFMVGDVMVDSLLNCMTKVSQSSILLRLGLTTKGYVLLTLHRPGNVDDRETLAQLINAIGCVGQRIPVLFPVHPRTRANIQDFGLQNAFQGTGITLIDPQGYLDFLSLEMHSRFVLSDSGGVQLETTVMDIPCLTLRDSTERSATITEGTNTLVAHDADRLWAETINILEGRYKHRHHSSLWDGKASDRLVRILAGERR